jgi:general secretion pathway protein I
VKGYRLKQKRTTLLFLGSLRNACGPGKASSQKKSLTGNRQPATGNRLSGFTLLEVLVAMAIVGLAVTAILELFSSNLRAISSSEDHMRASLVAEARMREVLDDASLAEKGWSEVTNEGYRIDVMINKVQTERANMVGADLYQIDLSLSWRKGMRDRTIALKTLKIVNKSSDDRVSS